MQLLTPDPTFYPSPTMAKQAPPETLAYVALVNPREGGTDAIGVVDLDPASKSYGRLIGQTDMPLAGDELHHFGWNACSSCLCPYAPHPHMERRYLVVPGIHSSRIHILDTKPDPRHPRIVKVIAPETIARRTGYAAPHTVHCGALKEPGPHAQLGVPPALGAGPCRLSTRRSGMSARGGRSAGAKSRAGLSRRPRRSIAGVTAGGASAVQAHGLGPHSGAPSATEARTCRARRSGSGKSRAEVGAAALRPLERAERDQPGGRRLVVEVEPVLPRQVESEAAGHRRRARARAAMSSISASAVAGRRSVADQARPGPT